MSGKKITFASKRPSQSLATTSIDNWVEHREVEAPQPPQPEPMKRLTIDVSVKLHTQIKSQCALQNLRMADVIRDLLEDHFGRAKLGEGA